MQKKTNKIREIGDIMQWSSRCREHYFPWRSKTGHVSEKQVIAEAGITESYPGYLLERSRPSFHLLVYPMEGSGLVYNARSSYHVQPGYVMIAPVGKAFGYRPEGNLWRFLWLHLPDDALWSALRKFHLKVRKTVLTQALTKTMEEFLIESRGRTESHHHAAKLYTEIISLYVQRELGTEEESKHTEQKNRLEHLHSLINSDLTKDWTVESMAEALFVSESHLHRLTREYFGLPPMKLVTRLRMERAQELLIMHDAAQRVIAEMVGYQNEFAFSVAFKRFSGVTPGEFRKRR